MIEDDLKSIKNDVLLLNKKIELLLYKPKRWCPACNTLLDKITELNPMPGNMLSITYECDCGLRTNFQE